jgi:methionine-rich copper-binding protein CopC
MVLGSAVAASLMALAPAAFAHAHLVSSDPAANAVVASPSVVTLRFNDPLEPRFSGFEITDAQNHAVNAPSHPDPSNGAIYTAALASPLTPGLYHVNWRLVAHDGHRMRGTFDFTVR